MQGYNVIVVFNNQLTKVLMCKRKKEPYKGLSNFVGGKIEKNEDGLCTWESFYNHLVKKVPTKEICQKK